MAKKKLCIVGGGATGVALLWALSQDPFASQAWDITLVHDQITSVGGHSLTYYVPVPGKPNKQLPIDIGVQFISPMMYPNVHVMLRRPEFQSSVPMTDFDSLKISSAFPRLNNQPMNWGNFPEYQQGPDFAMFTQDVQADIETFQNHLEVSMLTKHWRTQTLEQYFADNGGAYRNAKNFINYILSPYLSIINGYGDARMGDTMFADIWPMFAKLPLPASWGYPTPLGSFMNPGTGWQRFANGAQSWVEAMRAAALKLVPSNTILLNSPVTAVWTNQTTGQVTVQWQDGNGNKQPPQTFDKVVLTTDMWTNSQILNNPQNQYFWKNLYYNPKFSYPIGDYIDKNTFKPSGPNVTWPLMWGMCFIHRDPTMLSPDLQQQEESLQFNAYYAPGNDNGSNYSLINTFTTYIQKNVLNDPDADGYYLTMYGYIPDPLKNQKVPQKVLFSEKWTHGRWIPSAMDGPKAKLFVAQGLGNMSFPGQLNTNVYFAGNNTTFDSEEGALISALSIANYAFGVNYPLIDQSLPETLFAYSMYSLYHNVMFPKDSASHAVVSLFQSLPAMMRGAGSAPALMKKTARVSARSKKKSSTKKRAATKKVRKTKAKSASVKKSKPAKKPVKKPVKAKKKARTTRRK